MIINDGGWCVAPAQLTAQAFACRLLHIGQKGSMLKGLIIITIHVRVSRAQRPHIFVNMVK